MTNPIEFHMDTVIEILDRFNCLDEISSMSVICTMIDTIGTKLGKDPREVAALISESVIDVNDTLGPMEYIEYSNI